LDNCKLFRDKALGHICYLLTFYTFFKTESYFISTKFVNLQINKESTLNNTKDKDFLSKGIFDNKEMTLYEVKC
jgi:hypothetical protein